MAKAKAKAKPRDAEELPREDPKDVRLSNRLPQGVAKLGTLQTRYFMAQAKAKTKAAKRPPREEPKDATPSAKRQRTLRQMLESGAAEHSGSDHVESGASEHGGRIHGDDPSALTSTDLFTDDSDEDRALLDWLRERTEHSRCAALLQQIMEWSVEL